MVKAIHDLSFGDRVFVEVDGKWRVATLIIIHAGFGYAVLTSFYFNPDAPYYKNCNCNFRIVRVGVNLLRLLQSPQVDVAVLRMQRNADCLEGVLTECVRQGLPQDVSLNLQSQLKSQQLKFEQKEADMASAGLAGQNPIEDFSQKPSVNELHKPAAREPKGQFYVYHTDGKGPKYIHLTYEDALQEARRLAHQSRSRAQFEVLRIEARVSVRIEARVSVETVMQTKVDEYK